MLKYVHHARVQTVHLFPPSIFQSICLIPSKMIIGRIDIKIVSTTLRIFIDFGFYREIEKKAGLLSIKNR